MKKVFLAIPLNANIDEETQKYTVETMKVFTRLIFKEEEIQFVMSFCNTYVNSSDVNQIEMWKAGTAIMKLAECDLAIIPEDYLQFNDIYLEKIAANAYGIKIHYCPMAILPEKINKLAETLTTAQARFMNEVPL